MNNPLLVLVFCLLLSILIGVAIKKSVKIAQAYYKRKPWNCSEHVRRLKEGFDEDLYKHEKGLGMSPLPPGCELIDRKEVLELYKEYKQKGEQEALAFCKMVIKMNLKGEL